MRVRQLHRRFHHGYWTRKLIDDIEQSSYRSVIESLNKIAEKMEITKAYLDKPEVLQ